MTITPKITLDQWRALLAVVDAGGYAQAAENLHKSQSAVTYAVQKLESLLGVKVFEVIGPRPASSCTRACSAGPRRCCFSARSIWRSAHKCRPASSAIR